MSADGYLAELSEKHRTLERKIADEMTRPAANVHLIAKWKLEKLKLKDAMVRLAGATRH